VLTSILRRWLTPTVQLHLNVPEWSEAMAEHHASIWRQVKPYTTMAIEHVAALCQCVAYLENRQVPGAIVECGVGNGGVMVSALALLALGSTNRNLFLYHTSVESLAEVKHALMQTRYPWEKLRFIHSPIEATIPNHLPDQIALLRLDTDQRDSSFHALDYLEPRLVDGGVLIVDGRVEVIPMPPATLAA
jgi:O-methyltransferase